MTTNKTPGKPKFQGGRLPLPALFYFLPSGQCSFRQSSKEQLKASGDNLPSSIRCVLASNMDHPVDRRNAEEANATLEEFDRWVMTVRDPASKTTAGVRTIGSRKMKAEASYEIAPLPDDRFAMRSTLLYWSGNCHGHGSPWDAYDTREQCVTAFLEAARLHFSRPVHGPSHQDVADGYRSQRQAQAKMQKLLEADGLFGFMEPEPVIAVENSNEN